MYDFSLLEIPNIYCLSYEYTLKSLWPESGLCWIFRWLRSAPKFPLFWFRDPFPSYKRRYYLKRKRGSTNVLETSRLDWEIGTALIWTKLFNRDEGKEREIGRCAGLSLALSVYYICCTTVRDPVLPKPLPVIRNFYWIECCYTPKIYCCFTIDNCLFLDWIRTQ